MKVFSSPTQNTGKIGEDIAVRYLENNGFEIVERNHTKKWGEIDIVAEKKNIIHLIEVKSVSLPGLSIDKLSVRPEENLNEQKIERLRRVVETYLLGRHITDRTKWQFDLICVYMDDVNKKAKVITFNNIIL
jgi:putative endonuclease